MNNATNTVKEQNVAVRRRQLRSSTEQLGCARYFSTPVAATETEGR